MNKFLSLILLLCSAGNVWSQIDEKTFIHVTNKKIDLPEGNRNFEKIAEHPTDVPTTPQEYKLEEISLFLPKLTTKIDIVRIKPAPITKLYGNYVKAGFGNYTTPYFEGFFNNKRSENLSYGLHLKHFSSSKGPVSFSGFSENTGDGYVRYIKKNNEFYSSLGYTKERYNFYGYNHEVPADEDTLKKSFNTLSFKAGVKSINSNSDFNYNFNFSYFNFSDNFKAKESEYLPNLILGYKIDSEKSIVADAILSISNKKDTVDINRTYFQIRPAFIYKMDNFKLIGGLNFAYVNDTLISGVKVYPRAYGEFYAAEKVLTVYGGIDGGMEKNTLRSFVGQNPFLQRNTPVFHSNKKFELFGGAKGNLKGLSYKGELSYMNYDNLYFFVNSRFDSSRFTALYDKNTNVTNLEGEVSYELAETFRLGVNMNYFSYSMGGAVEKPWHRPSLVTSFIGTYNLHKKIYFESDIYYISGINAKNFISGEELKLKNIFDVNLKVDYKFSNVFSAFIEFNNILSKKYQRYLYYPVKGFNVIGGITYAFAIR